MIAADEIARLRVALAEAERERDAEKRSREQWNDCALSLERKVGDIRARSERAEADLAAAREQLHYATGTCDLAMKHRGMAEAALAEAERERDKYRDPNDKLFNDWRSAEDAAARLGAKWKRAEADLAAARDCLQSIADGHAGYVPSSFARAFLERTATAAPQNAK
jgi:chromosome segregation ATPase